MKKQLTEKEVVEPTYADRRDVPAVGVEEKR